MKYRIEEILEEKESSLPQEVVNALEQTPASQLDIFYLKKTLGRHANGIDAANKLFEQINSSLKDLTTKVESSLMVEVVNGKTETRNIADLIKELWENDTPRRDKKNLYGIFNRNRKKSAIVFVFGIFLVLIYRNEIHPAIDWIAVNFFDLIKLIF